jgi:U3 small nucleolar RNA-associated protein 22
MVIDVDDANIENDKKRFKSSFYKPPTAEELNNLRETETLFHSNLFRMQINELLAEISLKEHEIDTYKNEINSLISFIKSISSSKERKLNDLSIFKKQNIQVPLGDLCEKLEGSYKFIKPNRVEVIGSFDTNALIKPLVCIDIAIEIPKEYFIERDFLNYRYFLKRILYISNICVKIIKKYDYQCYFTSEHSSIYKPDLILKKNDNDLLSIRLRFVPEEGVFKLHRFNPNRSNIRKQWFFHQNDTNEAENTLNPHYNYDVLSDLRSIETNQLLKTHINSDGLRDGLKLLKLWLYQRRLSQGYGSFSNYIISMFVVYLLSIKRINGLMSSYQIFRIVLLNLSQSLWNSKGITLKPESNSFDEHCLILEEYHNYYDVVFLDKSGYLNICSNLSENTYLRVREEAGMAIEFLNNQFIESFDALFIKKFSFKKAFDALVK